MKKNLLSIFILAAVIANMILSTVMLFSIVPVLNRTNDFILKICSVLDLEIESPNASDFATVGVADRDTFTFADSITINLKKAEGDKQSTYAVTTVTLTLNKKSTDYATIQPLISSNEEIIKNFVMNEVSQYTKDELNDIQTKSYIKEIILSKLREYFGSDCIYDITLNYLLS